MIFNARMIESSSGLAIGSFIGKLILNFCYAEPGLHGGQPLHDGESPPPIVEVKLPKTSRGEGGGRFQLYLEGLINIPLFKARSSA